MRKQRVEKRKNRGVENQQHEGCTCFHVSREQRRIDSVAVAVVEVRRGRDPPEGRGRGHRRRRAQEGGRRGRDGRYRDRRGRRRLEVQQRRGLRGRQRPRPLVQSLATSLAKLFLKLVPLGRLLTR